MKKPAEPKSCGQYTLFKVVLSRLLDDCSNLSRSYCTSTFTISEWRVTAAKWLFFVHFVGKNPDFPLCPCGFWRFCYHGVIMAFLVLLANQLQDLLILLSLTLNNYNHRHTPIMKHCMCLSNV